MTTCRTCARYDRDCPLDEVAEGCGQYINKERDDIMDWLNLHISTIDSPEATVCDPVRRATWVWLLRFCIGQENGGRIKGCRAWGDTTWQQMAKVRLREVSAESTLWHWDGDDLAVHFYPAEKEAEVQAKRANGRRGGRPRNHMDNHMVSDSETTRFDSAETERKGKEGERKGTDTGVSAAAPGQAYETPFDDSPEVARALSVQTFMEWKNKYLKYLGMDPQRGASVADWADLFKRHGWDDMCAGADFLVGQRKDPSHKIWPDQFAKLEAE